MDDLLETAELAAFTRIVEANSVSRAAAELRVPRATISRRLARLEQRLGVRLLRRTTRSLALTEAGEALYRRARIALDAVCEAEASVRRSDDTVRGELRIAVPPITKGAFFELLSRFASAYPEVRLHVDFSTRHVDLQREGYDVALRGSSKFEPGLIARMIGGAALIAVASPRYLAERSTPRSVRDLRQHRCLLSFARGELAQTHWSDKRGRKVQVSGEFATNDIRCLRHMAVAGLGIALLPETMVRRDIAQGRLVRVLERAFDSETRIALVYPDREYIPPPVRAFVAMFTAWVRETGGVALWPTQEDDDAEGAPRARKRS